MALVETPWSAGSYGRPTGDRLVEGAWRHPSELRTSDGSRPAPPARRARDPGPASRRCNTPRRWRAAANRSPVVVVLRPTSGPLRARQQMGAHRGDTTQQRASAEGRFAHHRRAGAPARWAMGLSGAGPVHAAGNPTAFFTLGVLTVIGSSDDDRSRSRGTRPGDPPQRRRGPDPRRHPDRRQHAPDHVLGLGGNDALTMDEVNGALPVATMIGGSGDDTMTGGSGNRHAHRPERQRHDARQGRLRPLVRQRRQRRRSPVATPTTRRSARPVTTA